MLFSVQLAPNSHDSTHSGSPLSFLSFVLYPFLSCLLNSLNHTNLRYNRLQCLSLLFRRLKTKLLLCCVRDEEAGCSPCEKTSADGALHFGWEGFEPASRLLVLREDYEVEWSMEELEGELNVRRLGERNGLKEGWLWRT